jgi:hypothetical protein
MAQPIIGGAIKDRVVKMVRVRACDLVPCPWNFRTHPPKQREAFQGILAEVGMAGAVLVRDLGDGKYGLIDGHLRREELGDHKVACLVLDVTEKEARKLLGAYDAIGDLAEVDEEKLAELLDGVSVKNKRLGILFEDMKAAMAPIMPPAAFKEFDENIELEHRCPKCGYGWSGKAGNKGA